MNKSDCLVIDLERQNRPDLIIKYISSNTSEQTIELVVEACVAVALADLTNTPVSKKITSAIATQ